MQLVVLNDRPSSLNSPSRCSVNVSSKPSSKLPAAEAFTSANSARIRCRADFAAA